MFTRTCHFEGLIRSLKQLLLPKRHLIRVNLELLRDLADRLHRTNGFQSNLGLESSIKSTSFTHHPSPPEDATITPHFQTNKSTLTTGPNIGVHFKAFDFSGGFAAVQLDLADPNEAKKYTFINTQGQQLITEPLFDFNHFSEGIAVVTRQKGDPHSLLTSDGEIISISA